MAILNTYTLVTLDDVREALFLEESQRNDDNFLVNLINRVSTRIENYCGRKFKARSYTEYHDSSGHDSELFVNNPPIMAVSGIWDDTNRDFASTDEIVSTDYMSYADEGIIRLYNDETVFSKGHQNIKVIYSGGYQDIPSDLEGACILWVLRDYRMIKDKTQGYMTKSSSGASMMVDLQAIPREVKAVLDNYKLTKVNT